MSDSIIIILIIIIIFITTTIIIIIIIFIITFIIIPINFHFTLLSDDIVFCDDGYHGFYRGDDGFNINIISFYYRILLRQSQKKQVLTFLSLFLRMDVKGRDYYLIKIHINRKNQNYHKHHTYICFLILG